MQRTLGLTPSISWQKISYHFSQMFLLFVVFLFPFGSRYMNVALLCAIVFTLLSGQFQEKWSVMRAHKATRWVILFFLLMVVGVFYSHGTPKHAWEALSKYGKILLFITFLPLIAKDKFRDLLIQTFILAVLLSIVVIITVGGEHDPFINPIDSGFLIGFCSFILLRKWLEGARLRGLYGVLFIGVSAYLLGYNIERSGYLIFFGGLATVFWQYFRWRGLLLGSAFVLSLIASMYWLSPVFKARVDTGYFEGRGYISEEAKVSHAIGVRLGLISAPPLADVASGNPLAGSLYQTYHKQLGFSKEASWFLVPHETIRSSSIGLRLGFIQYSWRDIQKHPWLGYGTGSFQEVYQASGGPKITESPLGHPHNEYVLVWFQFGIIGLLIFILWQLSMWSESFRLPKKEQCLLQGLLVCFALLGFCNASLYVNPSGNVFVILSAVLLSAKNTQRGR